MTDLIKLAEERGGQYSESAEVIVITADDLQQFAQRYRAMVLLEAVRHIETQSKLINSLGYPYLPTKVAAVHHGISFALQFIEELAEAQNGN